MTGELRFQLSGLISFVLTFLLVKQFGIIGDGFFDIFAFDAAMWAVIFVMWDGFKKQDYDNN